MIGDGKMNSNQGFNGGKPLFDNEFNNSFNAGNSFNNNGLPNNQGEPNNPNFNIYQPFSAGFNQPSQTSYNPSFDSGVMGLGSSQTDIPPELGEIKNLNEATVSQAPTMDVLGPLNTMTSAPQAGASDPLDAYEQNGFVGLQSSNFNQPPTNLFNNMPYEYSPQNNFGQPPFNQYGMNSSIGGVGLPNQNFAYNPQGYNQNMNFDANYGMPGTLPNQNNYNQAPPTQNFSVDGSINNQDLSFNSILGGSPYPDSLDSVSPAGDNHVNTSYFNKKEADSSAAPSNLPPMSSDILNGPLMGDNADFSTSVSDFNLPSLNEDYLGKDLSLLGEKPNEEVKEDLPSQKETLKESNSEESDVKEEKTIKPDNKPYEVLNYSLAGAGNDELLDMRLDESYDEPDSLEIMDVDTPPSDLSESLSSMDDSVLNNVKKIKDLVRELKEAGSDVETEEFDFENTYQIIIKLKK